MNLTCQHHVSSEVSIILLQYISGICLTQYIVAFKTTSSTRRRESRIASTLFLSIAFNGKKQAARLKIFRYTRNNESTRTRNNIFQAAK